MGKKGKRYGKSDEKVQQSRGKVQFSQEKVQCCQENVQRKYEKVCQSELSAGGMKRDVEKTHKCTRFTVIRPNDPLQAKVRLCPSNDIK